MLLLTDNFLEVIQELHLIPYDIDSSWANLSGMVVWCNSAGRTVTLELPPPD